MASSDEHPSPGVLYSFLLGKLDHSQSAGIETHLEQCEACCDCLDEFSERQLEDRLVQGLKNAKQITDLTLLSKAVAVSDNEEELSFLSPCDMPGRIGQLDHYEVAEVVGRGGMGIVLLALDVKLQREVALKVLSPKLASFSAARQRFQREARAAAAVSHDHIVTIHSVEDTGPLPYLVMEFVRGESLQQRLAQRGALGLESVLRISTQVSSALAAAHERRLVHRDVKPSNILLDASGDRAAITDFGLARTVEDLAAAGSAVAAGTPQYMSPEQVEGKTLDHRSDLFSLGSVMYAMCTGSPPFDAKTEVAIFKRVCGESPRSICEVNADLPHWLGEIIDKLHAKNPADRIASAAEVSWLLGQHMAHLRFPSSFSDPTEPAD